MWWRTTSPKLAEMCKALLLYQLIAGICDRAQETNKPARIHCTKPAQPARHLNHRSICTPYSHLAMKLHPWFVSQHVSVVSWLCSKRPSPAVHRFETGWMELPIAVCMPFAETHKTQCIAPNLTRPFKALRYMASKTQLVEGALGWAEISAASAACKSWWSAWEVHSSVALAGCVCTLHIQYEYHTIPLKCNSTSKIHTLSFKGKRLDSNLLHDSQFEKWLQNTSRIRPASSRESATSNLDPNIRRPACFFHLPHAIAFKSATVYSTGQWSLWLPRGAARTKIQPSQRFHLPPWQLQESNESDRPGMTIWRQKTYASYENGSGEIGNMLESWNDWFHLFILFAQHCKQREHFGSMITPSDTFSPCNIMTNLRPKLCTWPGLPLQLLVAKIFSFRGVHPDQFFHRLWLLWWSFLRIPSQVMLSFVLIRLEDIWFFPRILRMHLLQLLWTILDSILLLMSFLIL